MWMTDMLCSDEQIKMSLFFFQFETRKIPNTKYGETGAPSGHYVVVQASFVVNVFK